MAAEVSRLRYAVTAWLGWCLSVLSVPGVAALFSLFGLNRFRGLGEMQTQKTESQTDMKAQFTELLAEMRTLNKVIWTLVSLQFIPMFALLYMILTE